MRTFFCFICLFITFANPVFFYYLALSGPDWYTMHGWHIGSDQQQTHIPSVVLSVITFIFGIQAAQLILNEPEDESESE